MMLCNLIRFRFRLQLSKGNKLSKIVRRKSQQMVLIFSLLATQAMSQSPVCVPILFPELTPTVSDPSQGNLARTALGRRGNPPLLIQFVGFTSPAGRAAGFGAESSLWLHQRPVRVDAAYLSIRGPHSCSVLISSLRTETKFQEVGEMRKAKSHAKRDLCAGRFYWTNAGFPTELDRSKDAYTKSPLRSFHPLLLSKLCLKREPLRVSIDTTIRHKFFKEGKSPLNYKRPCYLAKYDKFTNEGVIFLGTSRVQDNAHRFAIVHSRSPKHPLLLGSLGTIPPYSFKEEKTYLNISHPLRVQFAYLLNGKFPYSENEGIPYDGHMPPLVAIAKIATQSSSDLKDNFVVFDKDSEKLFWKKHKEYHIKNEDQLRSKDGSSGAGPNDGGSNTGGAGPSTDGAGPSTSGAGPSTSSAGPSTSGDKPSTSGAGFNASDIESNTCCFSSCKVEDAPWGRVGDQRIGIDIPLVIEDIYSDSDEEMDLEKLAINYNAIDAPWGQVGDQHVGIDIPLVTKDVYSDPNEKKLDVEELMINYDAIDAPWGRVGDQRIGIDIPLVTEDIYSDPDEELDVEELVINDDATNALWGQVGDQRIVIDIPPVIEDIYSCQDEEMNLESLEEFQEIDNVANVDIPESSNQKGITTRPNPNDKDSSWSYTISKPYFVISIPLEGVVALLDSNHLGGRWRWTRNAVRREQIVLSSEGLSYDYPLFFNFGQSEPARRIFNWHTKEYIGLPPHPDEHFNLSSAIVGMIVDTSMRPYAFKIIEGCDRGTIIYDSITHSWIHRLSVPPKLSKHRLTGNASVASCKGIVFIINRNNEIVLYDTEKDKWDHVQGTREHVHEELCGIGSWDDRIFSSTSGMTQYNKTFEIWELVGIANPGWKKFAAMPGEMCSWLMGGVEDSHNFKIDMSFCNENLLIWALSNSSAQRFVLCNLAHKTWEKLEPPPLTWEGLTLYPEIQCETEYIE